MNYEPVRIFRFATICPNVTRMQHWFSDTFFDLLHAFPAIFTAPNSPNFFLARAMIGLIAIALIACLLIFKPYRPPLVRARHWLSKWLKSSRQ